MNEMAMVEYLLKQYDLYHGELEAVTRAATKPDGTIEPDTEIDYLVGRCAQLKEIIEKRFGMVIWFTATGEIFAKNSVCKVVIKRSAKNDQDNQTG